MGRAPCGGDIREIYPRVFKDCRELNHLSRVGDTNRVVSCSLGIQ